MPTNSTQTTAFIVLVENGLAKQTKLGNQSLNGNFLATNTKSILIISIDTKEQLMIEDYAKQMSAPIPKVVTTASFGQDAAWWAKNSPGILIVSLPSDALLQSQFLLKLKADVPKSIPLLLHCEAITAGIMQMTSFFSKVRIVKGTLDPEKLFRGLGDLMAEYQPGRQQVAPRFPTNQAAQVHRVGASEEEMSVILKNMSNTGAYFETAQNPLNLAMNETVKIRVTIPGVREYSFEAKVVWHKSLDDGSFGFGVTFTNN